MSEATSQIDPTVAEPAQEGPAAESRIPTILDLPLAQLRFSDPVRWLKAGLADFRKSPAIGLFYGTCFFLMGHALLAVFRFSPAYVLALSAGFLLIGPFLCLGIYDVSRALESTTRKPALAASLMSWRPTTSTMAIFAGLLLILELLWARASLVVFAVTFNTMPSAEGTFAQIVNLDNIGFLVTYFAVGGVFASLIFVTSVISIPMILDRQVDPVSAGLTSIRACLHNPGVMFVWGAIITVLVTLAMLPFFLGLLIVGPVIGHASWHAYRQITGNGVLA